MRWIGKKAHGMPRHLRDVPNLARLRGDPAFEALLSRLPTQWEGYRRDLLPPPA
jgi:hypothetical protein